MTTMMMTMMTVVVMMMTMMMVMRRDNDCSHKDQLRNESMQKHNGLP